MLSRDREGADQVHAMLRDTRATGTCSCRCRSIDLSVSALQEPLRSRSPLPSTGSPPVARKLEVAKWGPEGALLNDLELGEAILGQSSGRLR